MSRTIEKALQERNETFVAAFNKGDIKAMAASYATDCDFLSADDQRVKGRDALEKYFAKGVAESKGLKLSIRTAPAASSRRTWRSTMARGR